MSASSKSPKLSSRRSPETNENDTPNFVFGSGGDLAIVSATYEQPQQSVIPQHVAPQFVQSISVSSGKDLLPSPSTSQPLSTATPSLSTITRAPTSVISVTSPIPFVASSLISSVRSATGSSASTSVSTTFFVSTSTSISVSTATSVSISATISASTTLLSSLASTSSFLASSSSFLSSSSVSSTSSSFPVSSPSTYSSSLASESTTSSESSSPSSTDTTSSSIVAASATPTTESSQTPSPTSASISSDDVRHHPPFYVGVILGTILVIACLAAFIAWAVRLRTHARRHRFASAPEVPWANTSHDGGLEDGRDATFIGHPVSRRGSLDISSQDIMPGWEPRGDRDVGEPKRSDSYRNPSIHSAPASDPFTDRPQYPVLAESVAYPLPLYHGSHPEMESYTSQLPASNSDGTLDGYRSASTLGPLQVANMAPGDSSVASSRAPTALGMNDPAGDYGTPRENQGGFRPRFLGLEGDGLRVPWTSPPRPRSTSFAARRRGGSGKWEHLPPLPMPGESFGAEPVASVQEGDGWTTSLRSSLANAFNAVAATLPSAPTMREKEECDDNLTPTPFRVGASRPSTRAKGHPDISKADFFEEPISRNESVVLRPWTLEERGDGTGTVRFHGQGLDSYGDRDYGHSPHFLGSSVTLSGGAQSTPGTSIHRISTRDSQTPLIGTGKSKSAYLRPNIYTRMSQYGRNMKPEAAVSRNSSVYSMASATSSTRRTSEPPLPPRIPVLQRQSTMKISTLQPYEKKDDMAHERPVSVSRLSSSGCSFTSYYYGSEGAETSGGDMTEGEEAVHQAITDRRKKLRKVA